MADPDPSGGGASLGVAAAARRLGVAPATLRTWARRYGLGPSEHEVGAHRRYTPGDLARLVVMRRLTLEGVPPVSAAATALAGDPVEAAALDEGGAGEPVELRAGDAAGDAAGDGAEGADDAAPRAGSAPGGSPADPTGLLGAWTSVLPADRTPLTRRASPAGQDPLQRAVLAGDAPGAAAAVVAACTARGPVAAWEQVIDPARRALVRRWEATGPGVDADVLLTAATLEALRALRRPPVRTTAVVLIAAAEREVDPLPLHVLAAAVAGGGVRPWVLAPGLPPEAVAAAVRRTGPAAVLLHAEHGVADAAAQLNPLPRLRHPVRLVLSGPGWAWTHLPEGRPALRAPTLSQALEALQEATEP